MQEAEDQFRNHVELYSEQCISIFKKFIGKYEVEKAKGDQRLECICEAFDNNSLSLTFIGLPDMSNYCQILDDTDEKFMRNPKFISEVYYDNYIAYLTKYIKENHINEDEYDLYDTVTSPIIVEWLSRCWLLANKHNNSNHNLFYFIHCYPNEPAINLVNEERLYLDDLAGKC
ncbi:hypothetical protein ACPUVO_17610 [Pseudocolwellia sp. HL-MZ19]|uniref:hypothetical protein n=1 Tax=Pseudocolwellia sp. HL-MZ19 TaxID=3400846 RepID=UPI003CF55FFE